MKNLSRILWGVVLVVIGVIWGLNRTGVTDINIFFDGWWTLFIIVPSAISLVNPKNNGKLSSAICLVIGMFLLLGSLDVFDFDILWEILLPVIVVIIGLSLIFGNKIKADVKEKIDNADFSNVEVITATFGEQNINKSGEKFEKAEINGCQKINSLLSYNVLDRDKISNTVILRTRLSGDKITLKKRGCTKTLKKLWNEKKFTEKQRQSFLILESDSALVLSEPDGVNAGYEADKNTKNILSVKIFAEE